ncbi:hypothetical protein ACH5RR_020155 [Cinchona calisaya]|uniref:Uncharacterized protein n=1 Tax=Cinchona calisaya TaxID=153742 RepID=A0ABD2ZDM5_9GENT
MAENGDENIIGYEEEGMPWLLLPANVLDQEASLQKKDQLRYQKYHQPKRQHCSKSPATQPLHNSFWRSSLLKNQRTRNGTNTKSAFGGPGMQAVFLDSGPRSCGTGVFLPRRAGTHFHSSKPASPPVLLPSRVVQALNLNVHEIGLQIKSQKERTSKQSTMSSKKENISDASARLGSGGSQCYSQEIFLPKEWTY